MKNVPCFLTLLSFFLALGTGCAASRTAVVAKVAQQPPTKTETDTEMYAEAEVDAEADTMEPPGSLYEALVKNSHLAQLVQQGPVPVGFLCVVTGEFNIAPGGNKLLMETWCVEEHPIPGLGVTLMPVEDTVARRDPGKRVFRILYKDANVSVKFVRGKLSVYLLYTEKPKGDNEERKDHKVLLPVRKEKKYAYSFSDLSPETVEPLGTRRMIEIDR